MGMKKQVKALQRAAMKRSAVEKLKSLSVNEIAFAINNSEDGFLWSPEWRALRKATLERYGARCMCCGSEPKNRRLVNIDHIKPRKFFPELALDPENVQVLCANCNKRKGNKHCTDYRT